MSNDAYSRRGSDGVPGEGEAPPGYVSRVNQLDALSLDEEVVNISRSALQQAFKYFLRNPLDLVGPELEACIRIVIWYFTIKTNKATIGQNLLGLRYRIGGDGSRLTLLATLDILSHYLSSRQQLFSRFIKLPERTKERCLHYLSLVSRTVQLFNYLLFLQSGAYPRLSARLLQLQPKSVVQDPESVGYAYMTRELMWHSLTELLIFTLPLLNSGSLARVLKFPATSRPPSSASSCCAMCEDPPTVAAVSPCGHQYCHYCAVSEAGGRASLECRACSTVFPLDSLRYSTK